MRINSVQNVQTSEVKKGVLSKSLKGAASGCVPQNYATGISQIPLSFKGYIPVITKTDEANYKARYDNDFITPEIQVKKEVCVSKCNELLDRADEILNNILEDETINLDDSTVQRLLKTHNEEKPCDVKLRRKLLLISAIDEANGTKHDISEISNSFNKIKSEYACALGKRLYSLFDSGMNKNLPDTGFMINNFSARYGFTREQCAKVVAKLTQFASFDDFRELGKIVKDGKIILEGDPGVDQAAYYIMGQKLLNGMQYKACNFENLDKLDKDQKYYLLLDDEKLERLKDIELPENVEGIYLGDIKNGNSIFTSYDYDSIKNNFDKLYSENLGDFDSIMQTFERELPEGVHSFNELTQSKRPASAIVQVANKFKSKLRTPQSIDFVGTKCYNLALSLDDMYEVTKERYESARIFDDKDIHDILIDALGKISDYANSNGIKSNEIAFVIQNPTEKINGSAIKSQHYLAYKLGLIDPEIRFATLEGSKVDPEIVVPEGTKLLVYLDDYSGSGQSIADTVGYIDAALDEDIKVAAMPLIAADETLKVLEREIGKANTIEPVVNIENNGFVDIANVKDEYGLHSAIKKLENGQAKFVKITNIVKESADDIVQELPEGIYLYEVRNGRLQEFCLSKADPAVTVANSLGYWGSSTEVILPYMAPNTNCRGFNRFVNTILKKNNQNIVKNAKNFSVIHHTKANKKNVQFRRV